MADACPIPTSEERAYNEVFFRVTDEMTRRIAAVIDDTHRLAADELAAIGSEMAPPHPEYLTAIAEESLMLQMCGATAENDMVGKPAMAKAIAQNLLNRAGRWQSILDRRAESTP